MLSTVEIRKIAFSNSIKKRAELDLDVTLQQIYNDEQSKLASSSNMATAELAESIPQFETKRSGLYKQRLKLVPKLPESVEEVKIIY